MGPLCMCLLREQPHGEIWNVYLTAFLCILPLNFSRLPSKRTLPISLFPVFILTLQGAGCGMPHPPLFLIIPDQDYVPVIRPV